MKQCFIFFCRELDARNTAIISKLTKGIKEHVDIYALSYAENGNFKDEKNPNDFVKSHLTITRKTLKKEFAHFPNKYKSIILLSPSNM